jgi:hypothetical protein
MICPKCGCQQSDSNFECSRCGVVFSKLRGEIAVPRREPDPIPFAYHSEPGDCSPEPRSLDRNGWIMLALGPTVALLSFWFFWLRWTFSVFDTLVHEMGHAIFGWIFAYPSLPAFDLIWGGGVTVHVDRSTPLLLLIYALLVGLIVVYRRNVAAVAVIVGVIAVHLFCTFTKYHSLLMVAMGHGTELLIGGLFIYRSLSGRAIFHFVERPLYSIIGFFLVFSVMALSYTLLTSWYERGVYATAKGGHMEMDFIRIARDHLNWKLSSVALLFLVFSALTPLVAFLAFRYEQYIHSALIRLLRREPA